MKRLECTRVIPLACMFIVFLSCSEQTITENEPIVKDIKVLAYM